MKKAAENAHQLKTGDTAGNDVTCDDATGLVFPCDIDVKIFINNHPDTLASITRFVELQLDAEELKQWSHRPSSGGKYLAITASVCTPSREHIDALYQALSDHEDVIMMI